MDSVIATLNTIVFTSHSVKILVKIGCIVDSVDTKGFHTLTLHAAFENFMTDDPRCRTYLDATVAHPDVYLDVMNSLLSRNVCQIDNMSLLNSEIPELQSRIKQCVPETLRYACRQWAEHLLSLSPEHTGQGTMEHLRHFLFRHLLHWIELSSLLGQLDAALASLKILEEWLKVNPVSYASNVGLTNALHIEIKPTAARR
jgi:hypothetical protein